MCRAFARPVDLLVPRLLEARDADPAGVGGIDHVLGHRPAGVHVGPIVSRIRATNWARVSSGFSAASTTLLKMMLTAPSGPITLLGTLAIFGLAVRLAAS